MGGPADTFRQEAAELLESLEENLLELEADPERRDLIDTVFRALHTIKGSGEMFGFAALARFVHHFENAYELVRSGKAEVTAELIDISLSSRDHISALLEAGQDEAACRTLTESDLHKTLLARIETFSSAGDSAAGDGQPGDAAPDEPGGMAEYRIFFRPDEAAIRNGMRPDLVLLELAEMGECASRIDTDRVPPLEELDPTACYLAWHFTLKTDAPRETIENVFLFFDDGEIEIEKVEPAEASDGDGADADAKGRSKDDEGGRSQAMPAKVESVRVQAHRLDDLMDKLGELVIAQARLNEISERLGESGLASTAEEIERLVTGMRDATLSIRMLPIGGVFGKFRRVVRDLATELGKEVSLVTEGGETELDKNIIDRLSDPLVHIIRNAVDHGIESASERVEAGKPAEATLRMSAAQTGGEVHISVTDDGAGLNTEKIRERALERGLIENDAEVSDDAVHQLIFAAGFSTAEAVTSVSGRGVGMDAVRDFVEDLRGAVDVKSRKGEGTTVTLKLPLTLAIIDGLLVRVGEGKFVIPLASVEECVELSERDAAGDRQRAIINIRDELVPFLKLREIFCFDSSEEAYDRIVVVNAEGRRVGLMVDDVIGQHQTVIKSLSVFHRSVDGLAGCTILGDGSVALIIDPAALVKRCGSQLREAA